MSHLFIPLSSNSNLLQSNFNLIFGPLVRPRFVSVEIVESLLVVAALSPVEEIRRKFELFCDPLDQLVVRKFSDRFTRFEIRDRDFGRSAFARPLFLAQFWT